MKTDNHDSKLDVRDHTVSLGEFIAVAFDIAGEYSTDPAEIADLTAAAVNRVRLRGTKRISPSGSASRLRSKAGRDFRLMHARISIDRVGIFCDDYSRDTRTTDFTDFIISHDNRGPTASHDGLYPSDEAWWQQ